MKYFRPPFTKEHITEQFRDLSKILHPDKGGKAEHFREMTEERDLVIKLAESFHISGSRKRKLRMKKKKPSRKVQNVVINVDPLKLFKLLNQLGNKFK